jgi:hypothetical protein
VRGREGERDSKKERGREGEREKAIEEKIEVGPFGYNSMRETV